MERAEAYPSAPATLERNVFRDHVANADAADDFMFYSVEIVQNKESNAQRLFLRIDTATNT